MEESTPKFFSGPSIVASYTNGETSGYMIRDYHMPAIIDAPAIRRLTYPEGFNPHVPNCAPMYEAMAAIIEHQAKTTSRLFLIPIIPSITMAIYFIVRALL